MHISSILTVFTVCLGSALAQITTGEKGNATVITDNPIGKQVSGSPPEKPFTAASSLDGNVEGYVTVKSGPGGIGVDYIVKFSNLPREGGPFPFHIHEKKVPDDGNCTSTGGHLDPFQRGDDPACDSDYPQTCEVGDISGKYGKIDKDPYEATFHDEFGSMNLGSNASIVDRSVVVHFANKTRITCFNFVDGTPSNSTPTATSTGGMTPTGPSSTSTTTVPVTAAANALNIAQNFGAAGFAGLLYLLL